MSASLKIYWSWWGPSVIQTGSRKHFIFSKSSFLLIVHVLLLLPLENALCLCRKKSLPFTTEGGCSVLITVPTSDIPICLPNMIVMTSFTSIFRTTNLVIPKMCCSTICLFGKDIGMSVDSNLWCQLRTTRTCRAVSVVRTQGEYELGRYWHSKVPCLSRNICNVA